MLTPRDPSQIKIYKLNIKEWKKIFDTNGKEEKAVRVVLISNQMDFKPKAIVKDKEGYYIIIKETI